MSISIHCSLLLGDRHRGTSHGPLLLTCLVCSDGLCPHTESQNKFFLHKWLLDKNFVTMVGKVTNTVALFSLSGCEVSRAEPHLTHPSCPPQGIQHPRSRPPTYFYLFPSMPGTAESTQSPPTHTQHVCTKRSQWRGKGVGMKGQTWGDRGLLSKEQQQLLALTEHLASHQAFLQELAMH